jgi:MYXO-CTERM domain-containing protein
VVATADLGKGSITSSASPLLIGGPGDRVACPDSNGAFQGQLDEVSLSRVARHVWKPELGGGAVVPPVPTTTAGPRVPPPGVGEPLPVEERFQRPSDGGCAAAPPRPEASNGAFVLVGLAVARFRRRRST